MKWPLTLGILLSLSSTAATAQPMTFNDVLQLIKGRSTSLKKADTSLAMARDRSEEAEAIYLPNLTANAREVGSGNNYGALTTEEAAGLGVAVNLYRFGGDEAHRRGVKSMAEAASETVKATAAAAELDGAQALFDVIQRSKERDIARAVLAINQESLGLVQRLYERGVRPVQEVEKVSIDTADVEARLADSELALAHAEARLTALLGQSVEVQPEWPWHTQLSKASLDLPHPDLLALPERKAIAERLNGMDAELVNVASKIRPSLDLTGGYDVSRVTERDPNLGYNASDLHQRKWSTAIVLSIPLFDRYAARTDYAEQVHLKSIAELDLVDKDRQLQSELKEVSSAFQASLTSALTRELTATQARKLYERSLKNFKAGVLSANDLSLDQGRLYNNQLNVVRGWAAVHQYFARLCHVMNESLVDCISAQRVKVKP